MSDRVLECVSCQSPLLESERNKHGTYCYGCGAEARTKLDQLKWFRAQSHALTAENASLRVELQWRQAALDREAKERAMNQSDSNNCGCCAVAVKDRDEWARQCNMASEAQARALSRELKLLEALEDVEEHTLQIVADWIADSAGYAVPNGDTLRGRDMHRSACMALDSIHAVRAALSPPAPAPETADDTGCQYHPTRYSNDCAVCLDRALLEPEVKP